MVKTDEGKCVECKIKGNFRLKGIRSTNPVAVGDYVQIILNPEGTAFIKEIEDRKNYIIRRASNLSAGLEENDVTAIVAHNAFSAGYLAVQHTAALARNQLASPLSSLPFTVIRQETMYLPDNQKLLFPVV